jgi:hypothetical protein
MATIKTGNGVAKVIENLNGALKQTVKAQVPYFMDEIRKVFSD